MSIGERSKVWKQIWDLQIPNVEKTFLWRVCHESLPTRQNLQRRKVIEDAFCLFYKMEDETAIHILWQCSSARDVWCVGPKKLQKSMDEGRDFLGVVEAVLAKCSPEDIGFFAGAARRLWLRRNEVVHGGAFVHPNTLVHSIQPAMEDFIMARGIKKA